MSETHLTQLQDRFYESPGGRTSPGCSKGLPASRSGSQRLLAFAEVSPSTSYDIWVLHMADRKAQIAMNDPKLVRRFQRVRDLLRDGQRFVDREP